MRTALITGITGQDGSYLAELLIDKGYKVHGLIRRSSTFNTARIDHLMADPQEESAPLALHHGDVTDTSSMITLIQRTQPDEIYNLAAQSHVRVSFDAPEYTTDATGGSVIRLLEAVRLSGLSPRFYQASSSEMFGSTPPPQNEDTPFHPRSPYGCAKVFGYWATVNYREAYGLHASNGILFNHESPRRGETFVTRKISRAVARIFHGLQSELYLGNLEARRDWGYAPDYVDAMWRMVQQDQPGDYVVATGRAVSVREFCEAAFARVGLEADRYLRLDPRYYRPAEVDALVGDPSRARRTLGWEATVQVEELARLMVDADLRLVERDVQARLLAARPMPSRTAPAPAARPSARTATPA